MVLKVTGLSKSFRGSNGTIDIVLNANLSLNNNEIVGLIGNSGCGKSTVLQILGLMQLADSGNLEIGGVDCSDILIKSSKNLENKRAKIIKENIGFVYQFHHLFSDFTAIENLMIPLFINGIKKAEAKEIAMSFLQKMNLENRANSLPSMLSGGEKQRVAIARAIIKKPKIIFMDEPTGSLDPDTANMVFEEIISLSKENKSTVLMITHNQFLKEKFDRCFTISDKKILEIN